MKTEIEIKDCRDCPFKGNHYGHGECWTECTNKDSPKGYGAILWGCQGQFSKIPEWCPINNEVKKLKY